MPAGTFTKDANSDTEKVGFDVVCEDFRSFMEKIKFVYAYITGSMESTASTTTLAPVEDATDVSFLYETREENSYDA